MIILRVLLKIIEFLFILIGIPYILFLIIGCVHAFFIWDVTVIQEILEVINPSKSEFVRFFWFVWFIICVIFTWLGNQLSRFVE